MDSRGVSMMYGKNILPKNAPIVYFSGEWMSLRDFEAYSGDKGAHRVTMYILFYNNTLEKDNERNWPTVYAVAYHNYRKCQIISRMIPVANGPLIPSLKTILEFSQVWKTDITYGFLSDAEDDQVYFIGEINQFKDLYENILKCKKGEIGNLKLHKR